MLRWNFTGSSNTRFNTRFSVTGSAQTFRLFLIPNTIAGAPGSGFRINTYLAAANFSQTVGAYTVTATNASRDVIVSTSFAPTTLLTVTVQFNAPIAAPTVFSLSGSAVFLQAIAFNASTVFPTPPLPTFTVLSADVFPARTAVSLIGSTGYAVVGFSSADQALNASQTGTGSSLDTFWNLGSAGKYALIPITSPALNVIGAFAQTFRLFFAPRYSAGSTNWLLSYGAGNTFSQTLGSWTVSATSGQTSILVTTSAVPTDLLTVVVQLNEGSDLLSIQGDPTYGTDALALQAFSFNSDTIVPAACFFGHSIIVLADGTEVEIRAVASGQKVLVATPTSGDVECTVDVYVHKGDIMRAALIYDAGYATYVTGDHTIALPTSMPLECAPVAPPDGDDIILPPGFMLANAKRSGMKAMHSDALFEPVYHVCLSEPYRKHMFRVGCGGVLLSECYRSDPANLIKEGWARVNDIAEC